MITEYKLALSALYAVAPVAKAPEDRLINACLIQN